MKLRIAVVTAILLSGVAQAVPAAKEKEEEVKPGVTIENLEGTRTIHAILPGRLVSYALPRRAEGGRDLLLLVAPAGDEPPSPEPPVQDPPPEPCGEGRKLDRPLSMALEPRMLIRLDTTGAGRLEILRDDLPADASGIDSVGVSADGAEDLLLIRPGEISLLHIPDGPGESLVREPLVSDPQIAGGRLDPGLLRFPGLSGDGYHPVPLLGGIRIYGVREDARTWDLLSEVDLGLDAIIRDSAIHLSSPLVRPVGRADDGRLYLAAGPRHHVGRRLRTVRIDPLGEEGERRAEIWSRLPGPERILEDFFGILDGRPILIVTTRSAEKLSFFAEKRLRIFPLEGGDRSKVGSPPLLALETKANLWQAILPVIVDLDADGLEDLVLGYWKGLKDDTLVLDAYLRRADGSFRRSPGTTRFDAEDADRSVLGYGHDLDGDGLPDLILAANGRMQIHRGLRPKRGGGGLVDKEPRWSLPQKGLSWQARAIRFEFGGDEGLLESVADAIGPSRLADMDGDGASEILSLRTSRRGFGRVQLTRLERRTAGSPVSP
jgi:hypothetical protein